MKPVTLTAEAAQQIEEALVAVDKHLELKGYHPTTSPIRIKVNEAIRAARAHSAASDFVYQKIEDYEELCGIPVNEAFKFGWRMARTTNAMLGMDSEVPKHDAEYKK